MRRMLTLIAVVGFVVLAAADPALAKGPDQATITGPGLTRPIVVSGVAGPGPGEWLGQLADGSGLFLVVFGGDGSPANRLASQAPSATLGPKYDLVYRVPDGTATGGLVRQDLYPYAAGGPVTYTAPGQPVFGTATSGGWYRAPSSFAGLLAEIGVPRGAPAAGTPSLGATVAPQLATPTTRVTPWLPIAGAAVLVLASAATIWVVRTRMVARRSGASASQANA